MAPYDGDDDVFGSGASRYLSASNTMSPRRSPSRQSIIPRRSSASLRGSSSLGHAMDDDASNGRHSLAHELAVALMPEPSAGSKLLAEEFGIEYDEGAEGIDGDAHHSDEAPHIVVDDSTSFVSELDSEAMDSSFHNTPEGDQAPQLYDPILDSPSAASKARKHEKKDAMEILAENLESTDQFLSHLRRIDTDLGSSSSQQPALEKIASDVIRRLNDTARDREGQVRELLEYEREFRKIAGEVGGSDVLGQLDELTGIEELGDEKPLAESSRAEARHLDSLDDDEPLSPRHNEWDMDADNHRNLADDDDAEFDAHPSSLKDSFPPPPPITGPPTPAVTLPQLADLRSFTTTLISSLTTISEQTQINGAATTEAGRKIRALKNKIGGWRTDWDSAERSRARIERWEAGFTDGADTPDGDIPTASKRIDGRTFVQEHLQAFELALADAAVKTKAIMAAS
ncbi:hypothetical protein CPB85DRAFT_1273298 [Mucidula mucida]|nr:hypothetical protein CPB85DRAFT_1273298 [Mucidula mucida]